MSDSKKPKTAVEACREISKALRSNLDSLKKSETPKELSAKDAALRVLPAVVVQIKAYEEQLVKMRNLEKSEDKCVSCGKPAVGWHGSVRACSSCKTHTPEKLKIDTTKSEPALPAVSPESEKEANHKYKLSKVFEVLGKTSIMEANRKLLESKPSDKVENAFRDKDSVLPSDSAPKEIDTPDGKVKKGKKLSKSASPILSKKWSLGGKDATSKMATSHAMHAGSIAMNNKINKMPANQLPKLPSPAVQSARASELQAFTPKGKFDKNEEGVEMQKAFDSKGKFITPDKEPDEKKKMAIPGEK